MGGQTYAWTYNGAGQRVAEKLNGTVVKQWVSDGPTLREELDASNAVTKRFYAQGEQIAGVSYYYTRDHLGSVREMTDAAGAIRARYDYDPYGRRTKVSGDLETDFGYTGHYSHAPTGLHLAFYRAYDADLARWLSRDPIEEEGGINLYGYVGNGPTMLIDPLGLDGYWSEVGDSMSGISAGMLEGAFGWLLGGLEIPDDVLDDLDRNTANGYRFGRCLGTVGGLLAPAAKGGGGRGMSLPKPKGPPKPPKQFLPPTNPPAHPPTSLPPGHTVRPGPAKPGYPHGYWRQYHGKQVVNPSTGKPPGNCTKPEFEAQTHVPLPPP